MTVCIFFYALGILRREHKEDHMEVGIARWGVDDGRGKTMCSREGGFACEGSEQEPFKGVLT